MNIAEALEVVARKAAFIVGHDNPKPGDFTVIIRGTINDDKTATVGWEWYWRPPTDTLPGSGPVDLKHPEDDQG
jgi:hypothetical protein